MSASSYGKGSGRRPSDISPEEFSKRWEMAFGRHKGMNKGSADDSGDAGETQEDGKKS